MVRVRVRVRARVRARVRVRTGGCGDRGEVDRVRLLLDHRLQRRGRTIEGGDEIVPGQVVHRGHVVEAPQVLAEGRERGIKGRQVVIGQGDELSQHLYGRDWDYQDRRFDVHIGRIRRKIRDTFKGLYAIQTIRSAGYMFEVKKPD